MLIIEEPGRTRLRWIRTLLAVLAAAAILAAGAAVWESGRLAGDDADAGFVAGLATVAHVAGTKWVRTRRRRADFRWRAALVLPGAVRPGLWARWSRPASAVDAVVSAGFIGGGLLYFGGQVGAGSRWYGPIGSAVVAAMVGALAAAAFGRMRRSGYLTVTSEGVGHGSRYRHDRRPERPVGPDSQRRNHRGIAKRRRSVRRTKLRHRETFG